MSWMSTNPQAHSTDRDMTGTLAAAKSRGFLDIFGHEFDVALILNVLVVADSYRRILVSVSDKVLRKVLDKYQVSFALFQEVFEILLRDDLRLKRGGNTWSTHKKKIQFYNILYTHIWHERAFIFGIPTFHFSMAATSFSASRLHFSGDRENPRTPKSLLEASATVTVAVEGHTTFAAKESTVEFGSVPLASSGVVWAMLGHRNCFWPLELLSFPKWQSAFPDSRMWLDDHEHQELCAACLYKCAWYVLCVCMCVRRVVAVDKKEGKWMHKEIDR